MPNKSMEQLRSRIWPTREAAVKELKRNGFAEAGEDYELRQHERSWVVAERGEPTAQPEAKAADVKVTKLPARAAKGVKAPTRSKPAQPSKTTDEAPAAPPPEPESTPEPPTPEAAPEPAPPGTDLTHLPTPTEPQYLFRIGTAHVRQNGAVTQALELSQRTRLPIEIIDLAGNLIRLIDAAAVKARRKAQPATRPAAASRSAEPNTITKAAIELAVRPQGVTREELKAVSPKQQPWTMIIKGAAERFGYEYRTTTPTSGKSRTAYHLTKKD